MPLTGFLQRYDDKKGYLTEESYYVNGVLNGLSKKFREDGSMYSYNYVNGELNGVHRSFNKDGALIDESYYKDGEQTLSRSWYANGIKRSEKNY